MLSHVCREKEIARISNCDHHEIPKSINQRSLPEFVDNKQLKIAHDELGMIDALVNLSEGTFKVNSQVTGHLIDLWGGGPSRKVPNGLLDIYY